MRKYALIGCSLLLLSAMFMACMMTFIMVKIQEI